MLQSLENNKLVLFLIILLFAGHAFAETATITGGSYLPLYGSSSKVEISKFEIDKVPVTKKIFLIL